MTQRPLAQRDSSWHSFTSDGHHATCICYEASRNGIQGHSVCFHALTDALEKIAVVVEALLAVALVARLRVLTATLLADFISKQRTLVDICRQGRKSLLTHITLTNSLFGRVQNYKTLGFILILTQNFRVNAGISWYHGRLAGCTGVLRHSRGLARLDTGSGTRLGGENQAGFNGEPDAQQIQNKTDSCRIISITFQH